MNENEAKKAPEKDERETRELTEQEMEQAQGGFNPQPEPPASSLGGMTRIRSRFSFGR